MANYVDGSQNISNVKSKVPSSGTRNKKPDQSSQSEGKFSGARVSRVDNLKSKLAKVGEKVAKLGKIKKRIQTRNTQKKANSIINQPALSEGIQEKQGQLNEMLKDHKEMKNHEKMPQTANTEKYANLQEKYDIKSSLDLLLEIKKLYKSIPNITKQSKVIVQEFYQLGESLEKEAKEISSRISMELVRTSDRYREKLQDRDNMVKKSKKHIETVKSNPKLLRLAKDTLQQSINSLEAVKKECKNAIDTLEVKGKEEIQKKADLYSKRTDEIIKALNKLPEKKQNKFIIMDLTEKQGVPLEMIRLDDIYTIESSATAMKIARDV